MLPTKFRFIWSSGFGEDLKKSANQKQELPVAAMFVNRSGQNEQSLERTFHRCFLPSFSSFGWEASEEKIKMWKVNGQRTPRDGKSSLCLWQGELKITFHELRKEFFTGKQFILPLLILNVNWIIVKCYVARKTLYIYNIICTFVFGWLIITWRPASNNTSIFWMNIYFYFFVKINNLNNLNQRFKVCYTRSS